MKNATAMRELGLAPSLCCAAAFAILLEGALLGTDRQTGDNWFYGLAAALLMVAGWTQVAQTRLRQIIDHQEQRRMAGSQTFGMLRLLAPVMFLATQLLLILVVAIMTQRISPEVGMAFFCVTLSVVGLSAITGAWHRPLSKWLRALKRLSKRPKR